MNIARLALDFDDVVTETGDLVRRLFFERGIELPKHVYRFSDWQNPSFSEDEFLGIVRSAVTSLEWTEHVQAVPGAVEGILDLRSLGIEANVLTARGKWTGDLIFVDRVLERLDLAHLSVVGTGGQPKGNFIDGHTLALDDRENELLSMPSHVHRLLFRRPHNEAFWQQPTHGIIPVRDWPHVVEVIRNLVR